MEDLEAFIGWFGNEVLWTWIVLPIVALLGVYITVRSGAVQIRMLPEMIRTLADKTPLDDDGRPQSVSSFQAFTISAASRVGTGNIAGVATAIAVGGPGAVFWMWLMATIGAASAFAESTLAQLFKVRDKDGFRGGPAYYMAKGLRARWMGVAFAVILIFCFPFAFSALQANTIALTMSSAITQLSGAEGTWLLWVVGILTAALTGVIVFGGVRRIASVTQGLVPVMALAYLLLGLAVVIVHIDQLPAAFASIFTQAFGVNQILGATLGQIILTGVKRGMFSNEAGLGSAPNAGAAAAVTHPAKQGFVQSLGVYFDTMIVCSITAFTVLVAVPIEKGGMSGIELTEHALTSSLGGWATIALAVVVFMLAFSSIIGNYYYGEASMEFISTKPAVLTTFRALVVLAVLAGSVAAASFVWTLADAIMGVMAVINLVAVALLSGLVFRLLKDYSQQRRAGADPVFTRDLMPDVQGIECWENAESVTGPIRVVGRRR
ncbi:MULTISPECIES: alanine/glycine:cation symporter family protein [Microbacterium]|uniref:alanine/glycine:cation symporter family protein n=1 Tax=Microbacterium TaxID=33882 RepID=UPI0024AFA2BE|nr:alanine/glycine:cation symporter family protein [Microbacterium barkeri]MDI6942476.1 alanine/glycine:cation symporter family protein [Microbacterium barkeri]